MSKVSYVYTVDKEKGYVCPHCHGVVSYGVGYNEYEEEWRCDSCHKKIDEESLRLEIGR